MKYIFQRIRYAILIMGAFFTVSCATQHFMYAPAAVNAPSFTKKDQSYADLAGSYHGLDAHGGYAISDHVAVLGSWYWRRETHYDKGFRSRGNHGGPLHFDSILYKRCFVSLGLSYYGPIEKQNHLFYSVTAGYGTGRFSLEENAKTEERPPGMDSLVVTSHVFGYDAPMNRFFFQPALAINDDKLSTVLSVRWAGTVYKNVQGTSDPGKYGHVSNKLLSYIEPALTCKILLKDWWYLIVQIGASINTQRIDYDYRAVIGNIGVGIDPVKLFRHHSKM